MSKSFHGLQRTCFCFICLLLLPWTTSAEVVSFQQGGNNIFVAGYSGTDDAQILGADPCCSGFEDANIGGKNATQIGNASGASTRRTLIRFTGLNVMAGQFSSIDSAKIVLRKANGPTGGGTDDIEMVAVDDMNADWVEGAQILFPASIDGSCSWNSKADPTAWVGGAGGGTIGATQDTIVAVSGNDAPNTNYEFDIDPALVEQWINGGTNGGMLIKEVNEFDGAGSGTDLQIEWYAAEFGTIGDVPNRPRLEITYSVAAPADPANIVGLDVTGSEAVITWESEGGANYQVSRATNLLNGFDEALATSVPGTPPSNSYTDTVTGVESANYRIETE
jgi:hypothetical protein